MTNKTTVNKGERVDKTAWSLRCDRFDRAFPRVSNREDWLSMYLLLRDGGDDHSTAVETIRGEMLVIQRIS